MVRPKRMGAYNALDELLPGPSARPRLEPVPDPPPRRRLRRPRGGNALDALLPGPEGPDAGDGLDWGGSRARLGPVGDPGRPRAAGGPRQHLGAWNPLDELPGRQPPAPTARAGPRPARSRLTVRLPDELIEAARDAVAHLAGTARETTLTALAERGIRAELGRLTAVHNGGRPFPPRRARRSR